MLGVTAFGLVFTPVFCVLASRIALLFSAQRKSVAAHAATD